MSRRGPRPLTVMTRNLYLGGDVARVLGAAGDTGQGAATALAVANGALRHTVSLTRFDVRSGLLAREIAACRPDAVALQEVALWRRGPGDPLAPDVGEAVEVEEDFLDLLQRALDRERAPYRVACVQDGADVQSPAVRAGPGGLQELWTARLTVRDVLLCRDDPRLEVVATSSGRYDARLSVALAGRVVDFPRGFVWADLAVEGAEVRVVGTHLDSLDPAVALAQARELAAGPAHWSGAVVVLGDLNSDPLDEVTAAAFRHLLSQGFTDCWSAWSPERPGFTCGLGELLDDETPSGFDRRLDFVLARSGTGAPIRVAGAWLTGVDVADRDPATGLWASDHAGVVATLWL